MDADAFVIINSKAGGITDDELGQGLGRMIEGVLPGAGIVFPEKNSDVRRLAEQAVDRGCRLIVAGGGDGTVNSVASALINTDSVLGVLPLGTLNHFARDLGITLDLEAAVQLLKTGSVKAVDAGEVNNRIFLNNSVLGLYPEIVVFRKEQGRQGRPKWPAFLIGLLKSLVRYQLLTLKVHVSGQQLIRTTPIVFVGNNEYTMEGLKAGSRDALDSGQLDLVIPHYRKRLKLIAFSLLVFFGHEPQGDGFDVMLTDDLWIESGRARLEVSIDGEVVALDTPLHYRILPGALKVMTPAPG